MLWRIFRFSVERGRQLLSANEVDREEEVWEMVRRSPETQSGRRGCEKRQTAELGQRRDI